MADQQGRIELTSKQETTAATQFGSLGSGNHFFEVCLDERDPVWVVLHSGSRGIGNQLAQGHIKLARNAGQGAGAEARGPGPGVLRPGHGRSSRPTSATCCGPRTTPWPTAPR